MSFILNEDQERIVTEGVNFLLNSPEQVFEFAGEAGTGKSVVLNEIIHRARMITGSRFTPHRILPMAYTGQAAIVMRTKGFTTAKTIHSTLLEPVDVPVTDQYGIPMMNTQLNTPIMHTKYLPRKIISSEYDAMIIDEGKMVPLDMKNMIEKPGIKIIVAGDEGQLPPITGESAYINQYSKIRRLTQLMRQAEDSSLVYLAHRARHGLPIHAGYYPSIYGNVLVIEETELTNEMISASNVVVCYTNRTREKINNRVRHEILGIDSTIPVLGERVICRKNNWKETVGDISLANGLTGTVITPPNVTEFTGDTFTMDFLPDLINQPFEKVICDYQYFKADPKLRPALKNNPYNFGNKFELAYALTAHLSQGAEYFQGIYFQENVADPNIRNNIDYTGITRFKQNAIIVIPSRKYY